MYYPVMQTHSEDLYSRTSVVRVLIVVNPSLFVSSVSFAGIDRDDPDGTIRAGTHPHRVPS